MYQNEWNRSRSIYKLPNKLGPASLVVYEQNEWQYRQPDQDVRRSYDILTEADLTDFLQGTLLGDLLFRYKLTLFQQALQQ